MSDLKLQNEIARLKSRVRALSKSYTELSVASNKATDSLEILNKELRSALSQIKDNYQFDSVGMFAYEVLKGNSKAKL